MSVTTQETLQELQWLSDRISTQVRIIALGILATAWALLVNPPAAIAINPRGLLWAMLFSILIAIADLAQYLAGYLNTRRHHRRLLKDQTETDFDRRAPLYRLRLQLFWAKQAMTALAFLTLLATIIPPLIR